MTNNASYSNPVVVVGGGFGGLTTALTLSNYSERPPIILIEPRKRFIFLPLLYELLSDELKAWEVAPFYKTLVSQRGIVLVEQFVEKIDLIDNSVLTSSGEKIAYGQLVLATGAKPNNYGIEGVNEYSSTFNRYEDVSEIKQLISKINNSTNYSQDLVIVGAGATGIELACKISDLLEDRITIHLIDISERVLLNGKSFNQDQAEQALRKRSIQLHLNTRVLKLSENMVEMEKCDINPPEISCLRHQGLFWTAGVKASLPDGLNKFLSKDGRLCIDSTLRISGHDNVFAIGDVALSEECTLPSNAQIAMQQGELVAQNIIANNEGKSSKSFEYVDRGEMLSLGIGEATITGMGFTLSGSLAFKIRRMAYLSKMPNLSLSVRSVGAWLLSHGEKSI
ncbi:NAD(P)/FAD-dependent oxidoreductase [Prochlorococcus marinus]|uniref:NAD(P)/FAD-dependent oxidoreductase n=1 Tax=Prochlorococcus marinus TaxID=1219 RepID=UPI0022B4EC7F|nr:FAD-dependent oxidoreductase [Prochlorococcus marinus]